MHKLSVVIIEDEPIVMAGLCSIINSENSGWAVVGTADNGQQGLKVVQELRPDIILTDIRMPYVDGLELIKRIRQYDEDVIVIILTGHADFNYAQLALKYSVFDYILKPSSPREILSVLSRAEAAIAKVKHTNQVKESKAGAENTLTKLRDAVLGNEFYELIRTKEAHVITGRFKDAAESSGFWSLDIRKAIKTAEKIANELLNKLMDDRMLTFIGLMELRQHLVKIYKIIDINELKQFLEEFTSDLALHVCSDTSNNVMIKKALDYVNEDITRDMSLKDIADKMFLNYSYLSQLFKKETSMNFSDYLIYRRMDKARELLSDIRYKTYKIASAVGYNNPKHFSNTFRRIYGLSPTEYRSMFSD